MEDIIDRVNDNMDSVENIVNKVNDNMDNMQSIVDQTNAILPMVKPYAIVLGVMVTLSLVISIVTLIIVIKNKKDNK